MNRSYSFLGVIDDKVKEFPWKFKINDNYINLSLLNSLFTGNPVIINDGHLLLHDLGLRALMNQDSLLWNLIDKKFIYIMNRGGEEFGLDELPYKMADKVPTYDNLIKNGRGGVDWREMKLKLNELNYKLRLNDQYIPFPKFDTGSGYLELSKRFIQNKTSSDSAGLDKNIKDNHFQDFIKRFVELINLDFAAPRTKWEQLAQRTANTSSNGKLVYNNLMNLANEMYHYNMGIMLSSELDAEISVETQTSDAFDDLLIERNILVSEFEQLPSLNIPNQLLTVSPKKLVKILDPNSEIAKAKKRYLQVKAEHVTSSHSFYNTNLKILKGSLKEYSELLSEEFGKEFRFPIVESFIGFALSQAIGLATGHPLQGTFAGFATGYGIFMFKNSAYNKITERFRVFYAEKEMLNNKIAYNKSQNIINKIKGRKIPSSIQIDKKVAQQITSKMKPFNL